MIDVNKGDTVQVEFTSESRTEFSGNQFSGQGVVDRVEDGRVYGRLETGIPFMCALTDVLQIVESDIHAQFQKWFSEQDFYSNLRFIYGVSLFTRDFDAYRILPVQMTFSAYQYRCENP